MTSELERSRGLIVAASFSLNNKRSVGKEPVAGSSTFLCIYVGYDSNFIFFDYIRGCSSNILVRLHSVSSTQPRKQFLTFNKLTKKQTLMAHYT